MAQDPYVDKLVARGIVSPRAAGQMLAGDSQAAPKLPTLVVPPEKLVPNYGPGRMFGDMIDHMQKEYDRLGIKPNGHFIMHDSRGEPIEYRRMTPEESKDRDWDFQKVEPADPNTPVG